MFLFDFLFLNHWHRRICLGLALTLASWRLGPRIALSLCEHAPTPTSSRRMPQTPRKTSRADDDFDDMMRAARGHHRAAASVPGDITTPPRSRANRRSHPQGMPRPGPGPSSSNSTSSPSTTSIMSSHGRSLSHADAASRHSKRLSLNFPVQPAAASSAVPSIPTPRSRPASWIGTSPVRSPEHPPHSPDANFFTALAAQERRVLELREELSKAEDTLKELKKQWATHEAARLGQKGAYGFHPLQPVDTVLANGLFDDDPDGPSWAEKEMERRRMILNGQRQSNRKVFSGSRHTRTLSLLSPTKSANDAPFSTALDDTLDDAPYPPRGRSSTTPVDSSRERTESQDHTSEALLRTGRQMATDLKDGLITFWGDLRQAAIGDEPAASPPRSTPQQNRRRLTNEGGLSRSRTVNIARRKSKSIHPSGDSSSLIDIESNFWKEHGIEAVRAPQPAVVKPAPAKSPQKTLRSQPSSQTLDEAWDDWDTTEPEKENTKFAPGSHSSSNSSVSELRTSPPESERSSPRTSTRYVATTAGQVR
ncbi:uncharacterized protein BKA78DRAFT_181692 [Phyllosticta capitalensis]|uniref:uncharacterized protein n=1 Tax=Phyllosticta capitalensis TaxID=121624 RepID=UPI003131152A